MVFGVRLRRTRNDSKQDVSLRGVAPKAPRRSNPFVAPLAGDGMMASLFPLALPDAVPPFDGLSVTFGYVRLRRTSSHVFQGDCFVRLRRTRNDSKQDVSLRGVAPKAPRRSNPFVAPLAGDGMMLWLFPLALLDAVSRFDGLSVTFGYVRLRRTSSHVFQGDCFVRLRRTRNDSKQDVSLRGVAPKAPRR
ncbi:MAG: hypothetical protein ACP5JH_11850, partial [Bacteroidota bacterium]